MVVREESNGRVVYMWETDTFVFESCIDRAPSAIDRPLSVGCIVTSKCNLECPMCYGDDGSLPTGHLRVDEWGEIFANLRQLGFLRVDLSGGEPTLRRDLCDIVDAAKRTGLAVVISTNGMHPAEPLVARLPKDVRIHVSIDGSTASLHEGNRIRHTGKASTGSFEQVRNFIRKMIRAGFHVRVLTAIGHFNSDDVIAMGEMLNLLGVTDWNISMVLRAGRAMEDYDNVWAVDAARVMEQVRLVREAYPQIMIGFSDRTDQNGYFALVLNDGSMATQFTDGSDKHVIGDAADITIEELRRHPDFDLRAHAAKWIAQPISCQRIDCPKHSHSPREVERSNSAVWIDDRTAAIGRLDGHMIIARRENGTTDLWQVSVSTEPVEMIAAIGGERLVTSYGDAALAIWLRDGGNFVVDSIVPYPEAWGAACAGLHLSDHGLLITGHRAGMLCIWRITEEMIVVATAITMCSPAPIVAPGPLWDIRAIARWGETSVVTGSEDGDVCIVDVTSGTIVHRQRYNPTARRGINSLAIHENTMLLGNCAVGREDSNIWLYRIEPDRSFVLLDSAHPIATTAAEQAFDFSVQLIEHDGLRFYVSTEEGMVWTGRVMDDRLVITGSQKLEEEGGLVLAAGLEGCLLAAGRELHVLETSGARWLM